MKKILFTAMLMLSVSAVTMAINTSEEGTKCECKACEGKEKCDGKCCTKHAEEAKKECTKEEGKKACCKKGEKSCHKKK